MNGSAVASQSGRSTRRGQGTVPVQNASPSKRSSRAGGAIATSTPVTRRSARAEANQSAQARDMIANPALPDIQTRQSYAYGASKAPVLPEQLHAKGSMTLRQVADQMNTDVHRAQRNLGERASHLKSDYNQPEATNGQTIQNDALQPLRPISNSHLARPETPASQTTEVRKQQRTAAWASSLDESQLSAVTEESSEEGTPESRRTEPSSFPSINMDHSYAYERGSRGPRAQQLRQPSKILTLFRKMEQKTTASYQKMIHAARSAGQNMQRLILEWTRFAGEMSAALPKSSTAAVLLKTMYFVLATVAISMGICFLYRHHLCDPSSTSGFSQAVQSMCGTCVNSNFGSWNLSGGDDSNSNHKIAAALNSINHKIQTLETRLNRRIDSKHNSVQGEIDGLRSQQRDLTRLLQNLGGQHGNGADTAVTSPLIPRVNFFAPANGAIVNPWHTSPTRIRSQSMPARVVLRALGLNKYNVNGPLVALKPWQDVGDCWCASVTSPGQDRIRLGVGVNQAIYATELVIEHPPSDLSLTPDTAPREFELWAETTYLTKSQISSLDIESMRLDSSGVRDPLLSLTQNFKPPSSIPASARDNVHIPAFLKIASGTYKMSRPTSSSASAASRHHHQQQPQSHVQRFPLVVNQIQHSLDDNNDQSDETRFPARNFILRIRTTHGADYGCLYRVRLHGVPVQPSERQSRFEKEWNDDDDSADRTTNINDDDDDDSVELL